MPTTPALPDKANPRNRPRAGRRRHRGGPTALPPVLALAPPRSRPTLPLPRAEERRAQSRSGGRSTGAAVPRPAHPGTRTAPTSPPPPPSSLRGPRGCRAARASFYGTDWYRWLRDLPVSSGGEERSVERARAGGKGGTGRYRALPLPPRRRWWEGERALRNRPGPARLTCGRCAAQRGRPGAAQ